MSRWSSLMILTVVSLSLSISFWWLPYNVRRNTTAVGANSSDSRGNLASFRKEELSSYAKLLEEKIDSIPFADIDSVPKTLDGTTAPAAQRQQHLRSQALDEVNGHFENRGADQQVASEKIIQNLNHVGVDTSSPDSESTILPFGYKSWAEVRDRSSRFPTVDERVRLYMTNWYAPPCSDNNNNPEAFVRYTTHTIGDVETMMFTETRTEKEKKRGPLRTFSINATIGFDELHYTNTNAKAIQECSNAYCHDLVKYLFPSISESDNHLPILFQFSDAEKTRAYSTTKGKTVAYPNIPLFKKFRYALSRSERERVTAPCQALPRPVPITTVQEQDMADVASEKERTVVTSQPIVFKLKMQRHYGYISSVPEADRPWKEKQDRAIFRGQFTGKLPPIIHSRNSTPSIMEQCMLLPRCHLVYSSASSLLVDAKLALPVLEARKDFPTSLDGVELYSERVSLQDMLSYKAIIMLEGNDVSSGLKWALFSNSVVMAQTPTKTSWAMEELLEPWKHYIPLADDLLDVEEKMQWVINNDLKAQEIAENGRLWISDLVFHPDADRDEEKIFQEIFDRYKLHFVKDESLFSGESLLQTKQ